MRRPPPAGRSRRATSAGAAAQTSGSRAGAQSSSADPDTSSSVSRGASSRAHQPRDGGQRILVEADDDLRPVPRAGRAAGQRTVHRRAHAHRVQAATRRQVARDHPHDLRLEADLAVGHQDHLALRLGTERPQGLGEPRAHLGAATRL